MLIVMYAREKVIMLFAAALNFALFKNKGTKDERQGRIR